MKKKLSKNQIKNAANILFKWRRTMPFYYAVVWIILVSIILFFN